MGVVIADLALRNGIRYSLGRVDREKSPRKRSSPPLAVLLLEVVLNETSKQESLDNLPIEAGHFQQLIERIERLEEEKKGIAEAVRDIYQEAKSLGYDPKVMRQVIKIRKMDSHELDEQEALLHLYLQALGMR
ncbi:conserved hypothetical protein [Magnetococcus marinus MC-1]|uniref:GapR-like DNA-binding domain-containing protein n=1 Tax=Magnetococcus marinus (strain ATCC BAA-1437 / JCM 17883 / MC-1) TaxID=156889 RepID=A0L8B2_MAGMM|nr:conserved hypothetical protein [Magnetococcus marinus MC-1]